MPGILNSFQVTPSGPPLPRTNLVTTPRCNALNTNAKNEMGPTSFYWHGAYSAQGSGGPGGLGPASWMRKTLNIASPTPADTKINVMNSNPDTSPISPSLEGLNVNPSTAYMLSFWVWASIACTPSFAVREFNSSGGSVAYPVYNAVSIPAGTWTRVNIGFTTSASTAIISGNIGAVDGTWANGNVWGISGLLFEQTNLLGTYFDGSMAGCSWVGTTDDSKSTKTS